MLATRCRPISCEWPQGFYADIDGLGERAHLLRAGIDLKTHISDVVNVMKWENLSDVVLCGHSYGGFVISGVAEQMAPAIVRLSFSMPSCLKTVESVQDLTGPAVKETSPPRCNAAICAIAPRAAEAFGVNEKDRAWVDRMCVGQPVATFTEKISLTGAREGIARKSYIRAKSYANPGFDKALAAAEADSSWRTYGVPCGHDVMVDMPERLTEILFEVAQ